ncbi:MULTISPECIES: prolyl oligopeptidase family serine peptidase [Paraburkholderia]|uniref:prolyl oligopeptidase family serine peptidase n=1 Tax=Paraburkholderia TaxID=1822464 RepID=UPI001FE43637|nr:prolyl oligopeptidase family serine peptidase [Paraburkholderia podalyriae]
MMTMALGLRLASAAVLAICLAGCGGGGDSASTDAGAPAQATALAATGSPTADGGSGASTIVKLQRYRIDPTKVFVAGISSGGFAVVQMHVAHSSTFKGAAVYAGGVYWCAGSFAVMLAIVCTTL